MAGWMLLSATHRISFDPRPFPFPLFPGNIVRLLAMFVILVGRQVLGRAADERAVQTCQDAEEILPECPDLQRHLGVQDRSLEALVTRVERLTGRPAPANP